uniref:Uncharacterized protein n=1 Tax=Nelumbo nucifera TaxID=4432 RepID=A0A822Y3X5_NELNU|nr:TPA_asm: hypothetical protein HUJ06_028440 [Nelumbo nucifera]
MKSHPYTLPFPATYSFLLSLTIYSQLKLSITIQINMETFSSALLLSSLSLLCYKRIPPIKNAPIAATHGTLHPIFCFCSLFVVLPPITRIVQREITRIDRKEVKEEEEDATVAKINEKFEMFLFCLHEGKEENAQKNQ